MENYLRPIFSKEAITNGSNYCGLRQQGLREAARQGRPGRHARGRLKLYQQADDVLLKDLPYIPVYFYTLNTRLQRQDQVDEDHRPQHPVGLGQAQLTSF